MLGTYAIEILGSLGAASLTGVAFIWRKVQTNELEIAVIKESKADKIDVHRLDKTLVRIDTTLNHMCIILQDMKQKD